MRLDVLATRFRSFAFASKFVRDLRGITAVEFALVAPIALLLLFGEYTLCDAMSTKRKLTITAHTIADLIARQTSVSAANLSAILGASTQIVAPYNQSMTTILIAEFSTDANGNTTVAWSQAVNGTPLTVGARITLPNGMTVAGASLIYSKATYNYTPLLGQNLFGNMIFNSEFYESPRITASVPYTN